MKRWRWKPDQASNAPAGVELGRCYVVENYRDEYEKVDRFNLIADDGSVVARHVPRFYLEECTDQPHTNAS